MIDLELARDLKRAGLGWQPGLMDVFAVPERGMDERRFVISDLMVNIEELFGTPVVAFQGASEWALDYLVTSEAVWLPSEVQLRQALLERLEGEAEPVLLLAVTRQDCRLEVRREEQTKVYQAAEAADAYGQALLEVLQAAGPQAAGDSPEDPWERGLSSV
jgi:hypothetical protein